MTGQLWVAAVVGFFLGAASTWIVAVLRRRKEIKALTLVPQRTRELMDALQSGATVVRRDRRSAYCNPQAVALGIARQDGALHSDVADLAERAWDRDEAQEEEVSVQRGMLAKPRLVHVRVVPLDENLCLALANDNTEIRAAEQSRREFAVNVSHELKTPVGALSLLAETIAEGADDPQMVRKFAKKMRKEARRLTKLIQEIIEISRLQGGESVIEHEVLPLDGVVHEAIEAVRLGAEAKRISIVSKIGTQATVLGDRDLLVMALRNLIDNAIQYSDEQSSVAVACSAANGVASVSVIDRGIGISASDQDRIFERFYRADPARSRDTGGTGLGLSIVKHIALQHSGSVSVWSESGVGSTFTFKLNVHEEAE
ncbi:sensor histidine kinase [Demequina pelophila]|uniref:sensor histidine kinase n=1 Tax=Demequina pelophila TaxID=1638984 RepID=UPI000A44738D|nr:ATP-binding protein [Demequina pelophila]